MPKNIETETEAPETASTETAPVQPSPETTPVQPSAENKGDGELAEDVAHMADTVIGNAPDNVKALIPDGLSKPKQAAWVLKAQQSGVFNQQQPVPATDTAKPAVTPTKPDPSTMPPTERIASGYSNSK